MARFIAAKHLLKTAATGTIITKEGYYDTKNKKAEFGLRPVIQDGPRRYTGNTIITNDSTHISQIIGNAIIVDTTEATTVIAGEVTGKQ